MNLSKKNLIPEISNTAPGHEISGLIELMGLVRASRIKSMQEAFTKESEVKAAKLQLPQETYPRARERSGGTGHKPDSRP